jgi:hypothetical protein
VSPGHENRAETDIGATAELLRYAAEVHMKVQTDVKAGGLLGIIAIVVVDLNLFGGGCCRPKNSCGGGCN